MTNLLQVLAAQTHCPQQLIKVLILTLLVVPPARASATPLDFPSCFAIALTMLAHWHFRERVNAPAGNANWYQSVTHLSHNNASVCATSNCRLNSGKFCLPVRSNVV